MAVDVPGSRGFPGVMVAEPFKGLQILVTSPLPSSLGRWRHAATASPIRDARRGYGLIPGQAR